MHHQSAMIAVIAALLVSSGTGAAAGAAYTAAQATQGQSVYASQCAGCHGAKLEGSIGPALQGTQFHQMAVAQQLTGDSLLAVISQSMPKTNPGGLSKDDYADITAYILKQNGFAAGTTKLAAGSPQLKAVVLSSASSAKP